MRLKLDFELEKPELDIDYRRCLISFIKHSIQEYDQNLFEDLYEKGKTKKKTYTYSTILNHPKFEENNIELGGTGFYIIFSGYNYAYLLHLYNAFLKQKHKVFHLNQNSMKLTKVTVLRENNISTNSINIKMSSPICVRNHDRETKKDMYYSFEKEEEFNKYIRINILEQMKEEGLDSSLLEGFSIEPINARKAIVKVYEYSIECSIGTFILTGNTELLNYLYKSGIGTKKGCRVPDYLM
ncbi:MAG: CRISPR-associated endoribonuclease Cas6 [Clostridia bacterium]|nr:CRISPR-associated endoribonuclease Cas6 [Clostridia bacterium]